MMFAAIALAATLAAAGGRSPSTAVAADDGWFTVVSWNVGHHAMGIGRRPTIPPGQDDEYLKGYRSFIGGARVVGLCEYSAEFSTNQTLRTVDALFDGYDVKLEGTDMFPQSNSIFAKGCRLIETEERQYPKKKRAKYYKFARVAMDGREVCVIETHLDFDIGPEDPLREARVDQMRTLIADMAKEKYVIICGDFNISTRPEDTPSHAVEYDVFAKAGYTLANRGQLMTWPSYKKPNRLQPLDNIIVKGFEMRNVQVKSSDKLSDHKMISCQLRFRGDLSFQADFAEGRRDQVAWDIDMPLDLRRSEGVQFDFRCSDLEAFRSFTVYFKSGEGWYAIPFDVPCSGRWCEVKVRKGDIRKVEGNVRGWGCISAIRISGWRGAGWRNATLEMRGFKTLKEACAPQVAVVTADSCVTRIGGTDAIACISFARRMYEHISELGVRTVMLSDHDVDSDIPESVEIAVFAYNPHVPEKAKRALERFVGRGGRIFACYTTDAAVRKMAGISETLHSKRNPYTMAVPEKVAHGLYLTQVWKYPVEESLLRMATALSLLMPERAADISVARHRAEEKRSRKLTHVKSMSPKEGEWRAFWCHSPFGLKSVSSWDVSISILRRCGFNAILPNVARSGTAYYRSKVIPVHPDVAKRGDQLSECLSACRKYGVECHAWKICWNMGRNINKAFVARMAAEGRCQVSKSGEVNEQWLCPSHPANVTMEVEAFVELAKTGVDGIHLDYIRYPDEQHCFCERCRQAVRGSCITALVREVSERVRREVPEVKVSAAVFTTPFRVAQDWVGWCRDGLLDFVCPMDYFECSGDGFRNIVSGQMADIAGSKAKLRPGIGLSCWLDRDHDATRTAEQIERIRALGLDGFAVFNFDDRALSALPTLAAGPLR